METGAIKEDGDGTKSNNQEMKDKAAEQSGNVGFTLGIAGYEAKSAGYKALGKGLSIGGDAVSVFGVYYEYTQYKQGKVSGAKFGYDATGLGASSAAEYFLGAEAGLETGGVFIYGAAVYIGFSEIWQSFKTSYNNWYNNCLFIIKNGGDPFERMAEGFNGHSF